MRRRADRRRENRRGGTLVLIMLLTVMLLAMVAFAVDVGRMYLVRSQLQSAVDAGALAATLKLRQDKHDMEGAAAAAEEFVQHNRVGWLNTVPQEAIVVETGSWNPDIRIFVEGGADPNAVRVRGSQVEPLAFGKIFGHTTFEPERQAIAAVGAAKMDIMMVLDLSGSMGWHGRIEALREAAPVFVDVIEELGESDQIGVMGYGALLGSYDPLEEGHTGTIYVDAPDALYPPNSDWVGVMESDLASDFDDLRSNTLNSQTLVADKYDGWTPTGAAIRDAAHYLHTNARSDVDMSLVLMSDGHANKPNGNGRGYAIDMAHYAAELNIKIYTISLGNSADENLMQEIADITGGEHFVAAGSGGELIDLLQDAFRNVALSLKRTQLVK